MKPRLPQHGDALTSTSETLTEPTKGSDSQAADNAPEQRTMKPRLPQHGDALASTSETLTKPTRGSDGKVVRIADPIAEIGSTVNQYELIRTLGCGGMGHVILARDTRLGRLVALKFLRKADEIQAQRFEREARATARLNHENAVVIHEVGQYRDYLYMVLEYIQGKTLRQWMQERHERHRDQFRNALANRTGMAMRPIGVPPSLAVSLMIPVIRALVRAHDLGIVHRDLKPSNIMLKDGGTVKVVDFGIAELFDVADAELGSATPDPEPHTNSQTGRRLGTLAYMSPEQWGADSVDHRTDLWAVGIILHELVVGSHPISPQSRAALETVANVAVPMPSVRATHPELGKLASIIDRCLLKRKADRMNSARVLLAELEALTSPQRRALDDDSNPYTGLTAFQETDAERFFGREEAVGQVVSRLAAVPLVALVGPSGAGKSSFIRAGVIPTLKRSGEAWEAFVIRPGPRPMHALAELLLQHEQHTSGQDITPVRLDDATDTIASEDTALGEPGVLSEQLRAEPGQVGAALRARARRKLERILLIVDQCEELYTLAPVADRDAFFACLAGVADDADSRLRVVLAMRSDFVDRVAATHASMIQLNRGLMLLSPMDRAGLRAALVRPLAAVDHRFESDALVEEMIAALEQTAGALPLLQFTAAKLWERRDLAQRVLTEASYRELGGIGGALACHADAVLRAMSTADKKLARMAFLRLVTPERTRAVSTFAELCEVADADAAGMERVVSQLVEARLLVAESSGEGNAQVEVVHESLIDKWPTLAQWLNENQDHSAFLARLRTAAQEWDKSGRAKGLLWRDEEAHKAKTWYEFHKNDHKGRLSRSEAQYLDAVATLAKRSQRRRRRLRAAALVGFVVVALTLFFLTVQSQNQALRARNATRMATAREYRDDPTTVLALLREIEGPEPPRGWPVLAKWALQEEVALRVFAEPHELCEATFSPDGRYIVTANKDKNVRIRHVDGSGEPVVLRGHTDYVFSIAVSPDGTRIASASGDKTVRIWNPDGSGEPQVLRGHTDRVYSLAFSSDGTRVVSGAWDDTVRVWYADDPDQPPPVFSGHERRVYAVAFSPDGTRIVSASDDRTVRLWRVEDPDELPVVFKHPAPVRSVAFSPDGHRIVTGSGDMNVRVWQIDQPDSPLLVLRGHNGVVASVTFSPDGTRVASASWDKTMQVWNADGSGHPRVFRGHGTILRSVAFSPDGLSIVTASADRTARLWRVANDSRSIVLRDKQGVTDVVYSPDGKRILLGFGDGTVELLNADGSGYPVKVPMHAEQIWRVGFSRDGTRMVTASSDGTAGVSNVDSSGDVVILRGHKGIVYSAAFNSDGTRVVTASSDKTIRVWNADGSGQPVVLSDHTDRVIRAAFSPDDRLIVSASGDKTARVWPADGSGSPRILRGHTDRVYFATFSPDGTRIVTASWDGTARVWHTDGSGPVQVLRGHDGRLRAATFSPDGTRVVTASQDKTVRVWTIDRDTPPLILHGHALSVNAAAFSPDGTRIVSASFDSTVRVWRDLKPLFLDDPRLWSATTYCPPVTRRQQLLGVRQAIARANHQRCRQRVRHAWGQ